MVNHRDGRGLATPSGHSKSLAHELEFFLPGIALLAHTLLMSSANGNGSLTTSATEAR